MPPLPLLPAAGNNIGPEGATELATALLTNKTLAGLYLKGTQGLGRAGWGGVGGLVGCGILPLTMDG
jgi:hypothetical protein